MTATVLGRRDTAVVDTAVGLLRLLSRRRIGRKKGYSESRSSGALTTTRTAVSSLTVREHTPPPAPDPASLVCFYVETVPCRGSSATSRQGLTHKLHCFLPFLSMFLLKNKQEI